MPTCSMPAFGLEPGSAPRRLDIERMFVMGTCNHEHLFGVKTFFERVFAFWLHTSYRLPNRCSIISGTAPNRPSGTARQPGPSAERTSTRPRGTDGPSAQQQAEGDLGLHLRGRPRSWLPPVGARDRRGRGSD